jgi:hypothetical protein
MTSIESRGALRRGRDYVATARAVGMDRQRAMMRELVVTRPDAGAHTMQRLGHGIEQERTLDAVRRAGMVV